MSERIEQARRAVAAGQADTVLRIFREATPEETRSRDWVFVLVEAGHIEVAERLLEGHPTDRLLAALFEDDALRPTDDADADMDAFAVPEAAVRPPGQVDAEVMEHFLRFYGGRRDVYAKAWFDARRKRAGYHPVEQPLTERVVRTHLQGGVTIGQYLLWSDSTCSFGVIDLDLSASVVDELRASHGETVSPLAHAALCELVKRLLEAGRRLGLPLFPEDSGGRGVHVWLHLEPRRTASAVRSVLSQVLVGAGAIPPEVNVEIFPKQTRLGPRGLSSLVKLPLGVHPATLRTCALLDDRLHPIAEPLEALRKLEVAPPDMIDAVVGRRLVTLPAPELVAPEPIARLDDRPTPRSLAESLRSVPGGSVERQAVERVLAGCAVVGSLVRKAFEQHALCPEESRALLYTIGLIGPGPGIIDDVFASARVPRRELDRMRRGLPNPAGCKKLARLAPPGEKCACFAGEHVVPYATPALFAVGSIAPSAPVWKPFAAHLQADASVVQGPLDAIGESLARIEQRLERLERDRSENG